MANRLIYSRYYAWFYISITVASLCTLVWVGGDSDAAWLVHHACIAALMA